MDQDHGVPGSFVHVMHKTPRGLKVTGGKGKLQSPGTFGAAGEIPESLECGVKVVVWDFRGRFFRGRLGHGNIFKSGPFVFNEACV
jgi:hypothetical protein